MPAPLWLLLIAAAAVFAVEDGLLQKDQEEVRGKVPMETRFNISANCSQQHSGDQLPPPPPPNFEMPREDKITATLLVRHLPEGIPHDMLTKLFCYYGASSFRPCSGGSLRNCAFVDFKDETLASRAQAQLNRLKFHKKILSVEKAGTTLSNSASQQGEQHTFKNSPSLPKPSLKDSRTEQLQESTSSRALSSEPIAPKLGLDYPFPPHLEYAYPLPDGNILTNIVNALIAVPRFYTQVLHLMNKMNIPAPFRMALPTPPLPPSVPSAPPPPPPIPEELPLDHLSSEESELESSDEDATSGARNSRKRVKREVIVGPATDKGVAHEDVGLKPATLVPKELPLIKKKNPVLQIKIAPKTTKKDEETTVLETVDRSMETTASKPFLTSKDLDNGKLKLEEIVSLPNFKSYSAGNPTDVLYIKNLAKDVVVDDFYYIFGSLFASVEASRTGLGIKLMKEGRMRDQAFVTFPSVDLAHQALNLVNGYVYKGKPMIIQFSRKSDAKGK